MTPLADLRATVLAAAAAVRGADGPGAQPSLERPRKAGFGDYSTNAAMLLAPALKAPPREIAERLGGELTSRLGTGLDRFEVAGPGFLNLFLADEWYAQTLGRIVAAGEGWGGGGADRVRNVNIEFVSANPTGPLHVGHARNGAYGDAVARMLEFYGHTVHREFYVNDAGSQVQRLGESIAARARGEEPPEDGYRGQYVAELAAEIVNASERDAAELAREGVLLMVARARESLRAFGIEFDTWFSERNLHEGDPTPVQRAFADLEERGWTFRQDGALWLRTTARGDDKDRVLERSNGEHTYFGSDIAYHRDKLERGFDQLIDVWGADHHGYVTRVQAAFQELGGAEDGLIIVIMQFVHLVEKDRRASMSKRAGEFVTLDELLDLIGVDAARWYLLARSHDTTIDLDLDLAREQSHENPVYYVQYAHARIASVLAKAGEERVQAALSAAPSAGSPGPLEPAERALVARLAAFPDEIDEAARRLAPHRIAAYATELAQDFSAFYRDCRVVGAEPRALEDFRMALARATQMTIARALDLLGVSAPSEM